MVNKMSPGRMSDQQKKATFETLWLTYYNDTLYAKGIITESERNKMRLRIKKHTGVSEQ